MLLHKHLSALYREVFLLINPLVGVHFKWSPDDMGNSFYITLSAPVM